MYPFTNKFLWRAAVFAWFLLCVAVGLCVGMVVGGHFAGGLGGAALELAELELAEVDRPVVEVRAKQRGSVHRPPTDG